MAHWFLSTRAHSVGGPSAPVKVLDADRPGFPGDLLPELAAEIRGRDVLFATHGFEVNQKDGMQKLGFWLDAVDYANAVKIGIVWPGDSIIPLFVDYILEGREAIASGKYLGTFLNANFGGAVSLSFASHSLGARVVLQTISGLDPRFQIQRVLLMAGAIDDECLVEEYQGAADRVQKISLLASLEDKVLALAFPLGNPLQGIIDSGHPYHHAAIGHSGPAQPYPAGGQLQAGWQIPDELEYGHHNYLPGAQIQPPYPQPVAIPPDNGPNPPNNTPPTLTQGDAWKPAWSAGFATTRLQ